MVTVWDICPFGFDKYSLITKSKDGPEDHGQESGDDHTHSSQAGHCFLLLTEETLCHAGHTHIQPIQRMAPCTTKPFTSLWDSHQRGHSQPCEWGRPGARCPVTWQGRYRRMPPRKVRDSAESHSCVQTVDTTFCSILQSVILALSAPLMSIGAPLTEPQRALHWRKHS